MLFKNALWLQRDDATGCLHYKMGDGVRHRVQLIEHSQDTEDQRDAGMEKEGLGPMMFTSY